MITNLPVQQIMPVPQDSHVVAPRDVEPATLIEDVVPQMTPPMEFRKWLDLMKSYAEAANRPQEIVDGGPDADVNPARD